MYTFSMSREAAGCFPEMGELMAFENGAGYFILEEDGCMFTPWGSGFYEVEWAVKLKHIGICGEV